MATKLHERIYLEKALELLDLDLQVADREAPDFELSNGHEIWGIEVRNLFKDEHPKRGSKSKTEESLNTKQLQKIANRYYENNATPILLKILGVKSIEPYSDLILNAIVERMPRQPFSNEKICLNKGPTLYVTDLPAEQSKYSRWDIVNDRVGWVKKLTLEDLQKAINIKSEKLTSYILRYSKVDLLLVCDRLNNSGKLSLPIAPKVSNPGFSNIYLLLHPLSVTKLD